MKKIIFTILISAFLSFIFYNANAQSGSMEYQTFKWNIANMGYPLPQDIDVDKASSNFLFSTEPQYLITNNIGISFKMDIARIKKVNNNVTSGATVFSFMPTGIYYFNLPKKNIRPWVSLGAGWAVVTSIAEDPNTPLVDTIPQGLGGLVSATAALVLFPISFLSSVEVATGSSYCIRAGIDLWRITVALSYNINPISHGKINPPIFNPIARYAAESSNNYFGITIGFFLGGGKKKIKLNDS